jgi:hypothetical protein
MLLPLTNLKNVSILAATKLLCRGDLFRDYISVQVENQDPPKTIRCSCFC